MMITMKDRKQYSDLIEGTTTEDLRVVARFLGHVKNELADFVCAATKEREIFESREYQTNMIGRRKKFQTRNSF